MDTLRVGLATSQQHLSLMMRALYGQEIQLQVLVSLHLCGSVLLASQQRGLQG